MIQSILEIHPMTAGEKARLKDLFDRFQLWEVYWHLCRLIVAYKEGQYAELGKPSQEFEQATYVTVGLTMTKLKELKTDEERSFLRTLVFKTGRFLMTEIHWHVVPVHHQVFLWISDGIRFFGRTEKVDVEPILEGFDLNHFIAFEEPRMLQLPAPKETPRQHYCWLKSDDMLLALSDWLENEYGYVESREDLYRLFRKPRKGRQVVVAAGRKPRMVWLIERLFEDGIIGLNRGKGHLSLMTEFFCSADSDAVFYSRPRSIKKKIFDNDHKYADLKREIDGIIRDLLDSRKTKDYEWDDD